VSAYVCVCEGEKIKRVKERNIVRERGKEKEKERERERQRERERERDSFVSPFYWILF